MPLSEGIKRTWPSWLPLRVIVEIREGEDDYIRKLTIAMRRHARMLETQERNSNEIQPN